MLRLTKEGTDKIIINNSLKFQWKIKDNLSASSKAGEYEN